MKGKYCILKRVQEYKFVRELALIKQNLPLHNSKILSFMQPLIRNDLLHVGGRLKNSFLPEESKDLSVPPNNHHVAKLIVKFIHKSNHR